MAVGAAVGLLGGLALLRADAAGAAAQRGAVPGADDRVRAASSTARPLPPTAPASSRCSSPASCVGDTRAPYKREIEHFASALSSIGEIVAFVVLGLTVSLSDVWSSGQVWTGLGSAALLVFVVRPLLVGALLAPVRLTRGERGFVLWAGLKGAVPIMLGTFVLSAGVA